MKKISIIVWLSAVALAAMAQEVTIDDLYRDWRYVAQSPASLQSLADGASYTLLSSDGKKIESYSYADGKRLATLLDLSDAKGECKLTTIDGYEVAASGDYILIWGNTESIYRHSYRADHYIYDVLHNNLLPLTDDGGEQEASFAPNGYMVSFVQNNNLMLYKIKYQSRSNVTTDGAANKILNGIPDWVNEEEFSVSRAYAWSPDSKQIAFVRYDETNVSDYTLPLYKASNPTNTSCALYPQTVSYKYPKAGEANAKITVNVYDCDNRTTKSVDLGTDEHYVPRLAWTGATDQLALFRLNRLQNRLDLITVNSRSLVTTVVMTEKNKAYVDEMTYLKLLFVHEGKDFIAVSESDGWRHLYLYGINGTMKKQLTTGDYDVTDLYGLDEQTNTLFYQAAKRSPLQREVYSLNLTKMTEREVAADQGTNAAEMSATCKYLVKCNSSALHAPVYTVCNATGKELRTLEDNASLMSRLSGCKLATKEFVTIDGDDLPLNAYVLRPHDFDESRKYPVVLVQYSGPGSQRVTDSWSLDWEQTLAGNGFVVVCVDPRGTDCRGEKFRKLSYQKLGKLETADHVAVAEAIGRWSYVDAERIGIWGWSYGGFISTLALCRSDVFKVGIAVAPVVSWRLYDTIYTERYLRRPDQNGDGYDDYSPLTLASKLSGKYLIISGTADDNVHHQNQMEMVDALVQAGKQFDMFTYPNRNHNLCGGNVHHHLHTMMVDYLKKNL